MLIGENSILEGKTAIVTGAARGIGQAVAEVLARNGANVIVSDIISTEDTVNKISQFTNNVKSIKCDVTNQSDIDGLIEMVIKSFGKIDILVSNAGVINRTSSFSEVTIDSWNKHLEVNLTGTFSVVKSIYNEMLKNKNGKIVCIGSVAGKTGGVNASVDYAASKGGIHSFVKRLGKEAAEQGIYVNGVAPGPVKGEMSAKATFNLESIPLKRLAEPEEIADAVMFLVSPYSSYIVGTNLDINGGVY